jgi:predicted RNase H-like HicB family nuclease
MKHKYKIDLIWDPEDSVYIAHVPELDGCMSHGKTEFEALRNVEKAMEGWIKTAKEFEMKVPEPIAHRKLSGTINVRVPKETHRHLVLRAVEEKISLNHLVSQILAKAV